ncbi:MAG: tetratricopeptide repeat protein [Gemmatimonadaceae bacterium]
MSNVEKLKKKAAEFEQKKQFDRALETYVQIIEQTKGSEDKDVTVYNRVGDLYLRLNKTDQAVHYYELAVDLYAEGGYLNNAIALCNKILRHAPSRNQIYYKLGKISAKKGFNSDAKKNFLAYADRMHKAGRDTDAFKALEEFADLCPGQDDIRLMLADQLAKAGKTHEAVEQLQILHESLDAEGRTSEAAAAVKRMHTLDPSVQPRRSKAPPSTESSGLVFLDLGVSPTKARPKIAGLERTSMAPEPEKRPRTPPHAKPAPEIEQLSDLELTTPTGLPLVDEPAPKADIDAAFDTMVAELDLPPLEGLEPTAQGFEVGAERSSEPIEDITLESEDAVAESVDEDLSGLGAALPETSMDDLIVSGMDEVVPDPLVGIDSRSVDSPFDSADPLAGLAILEDDRWYQDNPLSGLTPKDPARPIKVPEPPPPRPAAEAETTDIESLELDVDDAEEADAVEQAAAAARDDADEDEVESADEGDEYEAEPPRTRPRLVEDERPATASKRQVERPELEDAEPVAEPDEPARGDRKQVQFNPFKRAAQAKKQGRPRTPRSEVSKLSTPRKNPPQAAKAKHPAHGGKKQGDADFVDLADWLQDEPAPRSTRMVAKDDKRVGDEQTDFTDMLEKFKAGVAANVDEEDFDSHYDLGVAYREMGLLDEAIAEFQKALRGAAHRIRAYEALGQCFIDRHQYDVAIGVLSRALREQELEDDDQIGMLYLLGLAAEGNRQPRDAAAYYQRVVAIDIDFRDVGARLKKMSKAAAK